MRLLEIKSCWDCSRNGRRASMRMCFEAEKNFTEEEYNQIMSPRTYNYFPSWCPLKCAHKKTVCVNEEGAAGMLCAECGKQLEKEC